MSKKHKPSRFVSAFVKVTGAIPALIFYKPKVYYQSKGQSRFKLKRPFILVSNHTSLLDFPLYLLVFFHMNIRFLMAEVLFTKAPILSWLLYRLGAIYVNRNTHDFSFMGEALETLDSGKSVGVFPQGRLPVGGKPFPFTPSAAFIAMHTDAPVVPVYTDGNYGIFKRTRVMIGDELYLSELVPKQESESETIELMTKELEKRVYALKAELEQRENRHNQR